MSYYDTLEVSQNASQEVIRAAYRSLLQRYHPDKNPGDASAAARSVSIVEAYQVLSDPERRAAYDASLRMRRTAGSGAKSGRTAHTGHARSGAEHGERSTRGFLPLIVLVGVAFWFAWLSFGGKAPVASAPAIPATPSAEAGGPGNSDSSGRTDRPVKPDSRMVEPAPVSPRALPNYVENLRVELLPQDKRSDDIAAEARHALSVKSIGIVVGSFDPQRYIDFLERNKDYIGRALAEKLVGANHKTLAGPNGERYLKNLILDALGEITNTNRHEAYALAGEGSVAYYGAVDISLPQSFTIESTQPDQTGIRTEK
jgi:hypothetical protein